MDRNDYSAMKWLLNHLPLATSLLFYAFVVSMALFSMPRAKLKTNPALIMNLLSGRTDGYVIPGSQLKLLEPLLPKSGVVSFITDVPFEESNESIHRFYWEASNFLCPLILRSDPGEKRAIVFCSDRSTAEKRLAETGYRWIAVVDNGKGLAEKT